MNALLRLPAALHEEQTSKQSASDRADKGQDAAVLSSCLDNLARVVTGSVHSVAEGMWLSSVELLSFPDGDALGGGRLGGGEPRLLEGCVTGDGSRQLRKHVDLC